jgi:hypothetical protein
MSHRARLVRRDLAATAALFARSIDRHLAQHDLKTSRAAPVRREGITLSDGEGQEERAPTRRYERVGCRRRLAANSNRWIVMSPWWDRERRPAALRGIGFLCL